MNNTNKIIDYLQLTSEEYDERVFEIFWSWCFKYGKSSNHSQQLLANSPISNWWIKEYVKLESKFLEAVPHLPLHKNSLEYHFYGFVGEMSTIYPKALIDAISKNIQKEDSRITKQLPKYYAN
ncbi:hypothetical protein [uncultured Flavobacterium sp.]|uniref:hypothetical protein n=1 Tax=uncultured Flavobacterium sp. TaxID=165435 RepID=UPI0025DE7322|nr:hypothetical protein [uncultured Flavobacterium sp.]